MIDLDNDLAFQAWVEAEYNKAMTEGETFKEEINNGSGQRSSGLKSLNIMIMIRKEKKNERI